MANFDAVETLAAFYVQQETNFGQADGTWVRCHPVAESWDSSETQEVVRVTQANVRPFDARAPVGMFKRAPAKFSYYLQPATTLLTSAATVPTGASRPPLWTLLKGILGGESVAAGSTAAAGGNVDEFDVAATHGGRFPAGQLISVFNATLSAPEVARVWQRASDALSVWPELSNAPATGAVVRNLPTWYITRTHSGSLAMRRALAQSSASQWQYVGGTGSFELQLARGELAAVNFDLTFASYTGPTAAGYSVAHADDSMGDPFPVRSAQVYLQPFSEVGRTAYPVEAMSVQVRPGNAHLEATSGAVEGMRGVARTENLQEASCTVELTFAADFAMDGYFTDKTELCMLLVVEYTDTADNVRHLVVDVPRAVIVAQPMHKRGAANLLKTTIQLEGFLDDNCAGTLDNEQLAQAGVRIAIG